MCCCNAEKLELCVHTKWTNLRCFSVLVADRNIHRNMPSTNSFTCVVYLTGPISVNVYRIVKKRKKKNVEAQKIRTSVADMISLFILFVYVDAAASSSNGHIETSSIFIFDRSKINFCFFPQKKSVETAKFLILSSKMVWMPINEMNVHRHMRKFVFDGWTVWIVHVPLHLPTTNKIIIKFISLFTLTINCSHKNENDTN